MAPSLHCLWTSTHEYLRGMPEPAPRLHAQRQGHARTWQGRKGLARNQPWRHRGLRLLASRAARKQIPSVQAPRLQRPSRRLWARSVHRGQTDAILRGSRPAESWTHAFLDVGVAADDILNYTFLTWPAFRPTPQNRSAHEATSSHSLGQAPGTRPL